MQMGEVNNILITELRNKVLSKLDELDTDSYHEDDVHRIQNDDSWLRRFILHHEYDMDQAFQMVTDCLKWRKEFGVHDIKESNLPQRFFEAQVIYPYSRDKEDNKILMFHIRFYHKDHEAMPDMKRFLVYWMERIEREEKGHPITVIFDMKETGFSNMDMDFVKFFISLFKFYYPSFIGYLIVYELPWILNTAWKLVKTWLSTRAVEKVKFVTKNTIQDYVAVDQLPVQMGGTNSYQYVYEPLEEDIFTGLSDSNGPLSTPKKKVHFAETECDSIEEIPSKSDDEIEPSVSMRCSSGPHRDEPTFCFSGKLLRINPGDELTFTAEGNREPCATMTLTNNTIQCIAFKIKTTSPEKYRVRPSSGIIRPQCQCEIIVQLQSCYQTASLARDKFLIMALPLEHAEISVQELCDIWRLTPKEKIMEYKLRCALATNCPNVYPCIESRQCASACTPQCIPQCSRDCPSSNDSKQQLDRLLRKVDEVQRDICILRRLVIIVMGLLLLFLFILFIMIRFGIEPFVTKKTILNACIGPNIA